MSHHESPHLAIYDECYACAQAFHNSFKKLGFPLYDVSRNDADLLRLIVLRPTVVLIHLDAVKENAVALLEKIKTKNKKTKVLAHTIRARTYYSTRLSKCGADIVVSGEYDFQTLVDKLVSLEPSFEIHGDGFGAIETPLMLSVNDPFLKIASDPLKLKLTRLLAKGEPTKVIAQILNLPETDIENLRKKILHDTNSKNVAEYIGRAKGKKIV